MRKLSYKVIAGAATIIGGICFTEKDTMKSYVLPLGKVIQPPGYFTFGQPRRETRSVRKGYASYFDHRLKTSYCVIEHFTASKEQCDDSLNRRKIEYVEDSSIPEPFRSTNSDYKCSHYEHGHIARAQDHRHDQESYKETFFLSNISPQIGAFNRGIWRRLEQKVQHFRNYYKNVYVWTGPLFLPKKDSDGRMTVSYEVIGANGVAVPTHYFKVILGETEDGEFHMESYVIEHTDVDKIVPLNAFLVEKEFIEKSAGFLILNDLPSHKVTRINGKPNYKLS